MNRSKGFARLSRYAVVITPPGNLQNLMNIAGQGAVETVGNTNTETGQTDEFNNVFRFQSLGKQVAQQLTLHCNSISMPGHDLQAQDMQHGSAPGRQIVQSHDYAGTIAASFYLDSHLRERHYFEQWQKMAVSTTTHKANYYNDYIGSMEIFQLDGNNEITYGIKATEVYPSTIGGIEYSYDSANQIATQAVSFEYRQWYNLTEKDIHTYRNSDSYNYILQSTKKMFSNSSERIRDAIAAELGYESAAALKTELRNKAKGL